MTDSAFRVQHCRGARCQASIIWATTEGGKSMPVDAEPDDDKGNVELVPNPNLAMAPTAIVHAQPPLMSTVPLRLPHHATCVDVGDFRR